MTNNLFLSILVATSAFVPAYSAQRDLTGAWEGPGDIMVNICADNDNRQSVCYCGIYRTIGWVDINSEIKGDSLIMTAEQVGCPLEGRFRIESDELMTGTLTAGKPEDSWYFNGRADLVKQKPYMPENLNHELEGVILPSDYGILSLDREKAREVISCLSPESYGYAEKGAVEKLLNAKTYPVTPDDMIGFRQVRSIQIDVRDGIFTYPYFNCQFEKNNGKVFFKKTTGSQRKSGYVYQNSPESLIFLGGWSVNNDPPTKYGDDKSVAGTIYKIEPDKAIMIFPSEDNRVEIYELKK